MAVQNATSARHFHMPAKPKALEVAYRRAHGLPRFGESILAGRIMSRSNPAHKFSDAESERLRSYADRLILRGDDSFELHDLPGHDVLSYLLERLMHHYSADEINASQWLHKLQTIDLVRGVDSGRRTNPEIWTPSRMTTAPTPPHMRSLWISHFQLASWDAMSEHIDDGNMQAAALTVQHCDTMLDSEPYYRGHSHFGSVLRSVLALAQGAFASVAIELDDSALDTPWYHADRRIAYDHPLDSLALRLNPWVAPKTLRDHGLIQAIATQFPTRPTFGAAAVLAEWTHEMPSFWCGPSETPRLTMDESPQLQEVERMVDLGTYALREAGNDSAAIATIANDLWNLLSRDDVYPQLAYFNSTRLAMGVLSEALRWDGHTAPQLTPNLAGYGRLFREHEDEYRKSGWLNHALQYSMPALFLRHTLDPLRHMHHHTDGFWQRQDSPWYQRALAYLDACTNQQLFEHSYVEAMQYSVRIAKPDHSAAAVVVHSDRGGDDE